MWWWAVVGERGLPAGRPALLTAPAVPPPHCCRLLQGSVYDVHGGGTNPLLLGADAPAWVYSTAPLALPDGRPVAPPTAGSAGHAMSLSDQQARRGAGWCGAQRAAGTRRGWRGQPPAASPAAVPPRDHAEPRCPALPPPSSLLYCQVLILKDFQGMPAEEVTVEFWMRSVGAQGSP